MRDYSKRTYCPISPICLLLAAACHPGPQERTCHRHMALDLRMRIVRQYGCVSSEKTKWTRRSWRSCCADLLPEAWIAPPPVRQLRALLRHRASLVRLGTQLRNRIHAVAADYGYDRSASYWTGPGRGWLAELDLPPSSREIVTGCPAVIDALTPTTDRIDGELHAVVDDPLLDAAGSVAPPGFRVIRRVWSTDWWHELRACWRGG